MQHEASEVFPYSFALPLWAFILRDVHPSRQDPRDRELVDLVSGERALGFQPGAEFHRQFSVSLRVVAV